MDNPFEALNDTERTDDRYMDRVEFFLSLKKESSARAIARDQTKDLLKSKGTTTARLRSSLGGRTQKAPSISKIHSESASTAGKARAVPKQTEIAEPKAMAKAVTGGETPKAQSKRKLKQLLKAKS